MEIQVRQFLLTVKVLPGVEFTYDRNRIPLHELFNDLEQDLCLPQITDEIKIKIKSMLTAMALRIGFGIESNPRKRYDTETFRIAIELEG